MFVQVNTLQAVNDYFYEALISHYSKGEICAFFEITCEHFLGWDKSQQRTKQDARLSESELLDFHFTLKRLLQHEPIQYILEEAPFMGLNFKVSPATLIPRPETEELVDFIVKKIEPNASLLDIGTGSGCIPIAIKHLRPETNVFATDVSDAALKIARKNAKKLSNQVTIDLHDILSTNPLPPSFPSLFDAVVSNPPYVRKEEKTTMTKSVVNFEPHLALFVEDNDPLIFYRTIAEKSKHLLKDGGKLFFEINQYLAEETQHLISAMGYVNVEIFCDINSNPRILYAEK